MGTAWASMQLQRTLQGHTDAVLCVAVLDSGRIISGSEDCHVILWESESDLSQQNQAKANRSELSPTGPGELLTVCKGHKDGVFCLAVCPDGKFVSGSFDWTLILWSAAGEKERVLGGAPHLEGHTRDVTCFA